MLSCRFGICKWQRRRRLGTIGFQSIPPFPGLRPHLRWVVWKVWRKLQNCRENATLIPWSLLLRQFLILEGREVGRTHGNLTSQKCAMSCWIAERWTRNRQDLRKRPAKWRSQNHPGGSSTAEVFKIVKRPKKPPTIHFQDKINRYILGISYSLPMRCHVHRFLCWDKSIGVRVRMKENTKTWRGQEFVQVEGKGQIGRCDMLLGIWSGQAFFTSFLTDNHKKALKILSCISTVCGFSCSVLFSHQHSRVIHIDSFISKIVKPWKCLVFWTHYFIFS